MSKEREVLVLPEKTRVLLRDPSQLIIDNPAALILNRVSYESMVANFSEAMFISSPPPCCQGKNLYSKGRSRNRANY